MRVERNREIQAATYSIEPSPIGQVSDETSSPRRIDIECFGRIFSRERFGEGAVQPFDISTILG